MKRIPNETIRIVLITKAYLLSLLLSQRMVHKFQDHLLVPDVATIFNGGKRSLGVARKDTDHGYEDKF